jgi:cytochrome c5
MWRLSGTAACALGLALSTTVGAAGAGVGPSPQARAATQPQTTNAGSDSPGRAILQRKCTQCHLASMWAPLRQDRRAWEGTLYRMVGRGALWTPEEINAMAEYLAQIRGPVK